MEVICLSSTNYIGLTSDYIHDDTLKINQNIYYTEDGLEVPFIGALVSLGDNTINNFSNLFLTNKFTLSSVMEIEPLEHLRDEGFSTYLAYNAIGNITDESKFLVVQEPEIKVNTALCVMSGSWKSIDSRYMIDIQLLSDRLCKIYHENDNVSRYLTVDIAGGLRFAKDGNLDYLGDLSPQIFYYIYDRDQDYIIFLKNVNDIVKYVAYSSTSLTKLTLVNPLTAADIPYSSKSIFRCASRSEADNKTDLLDPWVSYERNFKTNSQDINTSRSFPNVPGNLLINSEYYNITGSSLPINVLSLKNTSTPENAQSRGNPFQNSRSDLFYESEVQFRDYKKLFTGSNQRFGNDNITIGYEAYSHDIILKSDNVTYFHIPQTFYPFIQLNINHSGLTEAGAIAGDHPLKADKIFKKLGNYKHTSEFGEIKDEASGSFLCSWLSGNWDVNSKPVWMDRYYKPSEISFFEALSTNPIQAIKYITVSDCLFSEVEDLLGDVNVFDKPSDLIFEPSAYYAYHHYGLKDVKNYINSLEPFLVQKGFDAYNFVNGAPVLENNAKPDEYIFNGDRYAISNNLSSIQTLSEFTMGFWMHNDDWNKPFGSQIIGNYINDGFGIFNQNIITPTLFVSAVTGAYILNTDLKRLKTIIYEQPAIAVLRLVPIADYYIVFQNGDIKRYNSSDTEIKSTYINEISQYTNHDYTESTLYLLCSSIEYPGEKMDIISCDLSNLDISTYTELMLDEKSQRMRCAKDPDSVMWWSGSVEDKFNVSKTVDYYNGKLCFTPGLISHRTGDTIYYLKNDKQTIVKWKEIDNITTHPVITAFHSRSQVDDFNIDYDGYIWVLANNNTYYKFDQNKQLILSGTTTNNSFTNSKIGFTASFENGEYQKKTIITQKGLIPLDKNPWLSTRYNIINEETDTFITNYYETIEADTYTPLSATGFLINIISTDGSILSSSSVIATTALNIDPTNSDFLRKTFTERYPQSNLNVKTTMVNPFDSKATKTVDTSFSLSALDPGYHHFAIRVDTHHGYISFFVDGQTVATEQFEPRKYNFNNFTRRPFLIGSSNFVNSIPLFNFLKKNTSLTTGIKIKDFYLFNRALKDADIQMLFRENSIIQDMRFTVPCGRRNYLEEVERYFRASIPGTKATLYNIIIKNSGISDLSLREEIEKRIISQLDKLAPAYAKLNKIKWIN